MAISFKKRIIWDLIPTDFHENFITGTINGKINGTPKSFYLPISKLHSILVVPNLYGHNNINNHKLLCASKFAMALINCSFKMGK